MSEKIVQFNEEIIKGQIKELVRGSVEETLNDLPGVLVLVDIELRLREHIAHHLEMLRPKACRDKRMGVQIGLQPDLHDGVQI